MFGARRNLRQPPFGARVNWGHPLAAGITGAFLFNAATADVTRDLVSQASWLLMSANRPLQGSRAVGPGVVSGSTVGQCFKFDTVPARFRGSIASLFVYGIAMSGGLSHVSMLLGVEFDNFGGGPACYGLQRSVTTPSTLTLAWNQTGTGRSLDILSAFTNDVPVTAGMTIDGTTVVGYVNGLNAGSTTTNVGAINYGASASGYVLSDAGNNNPQLFASCAYLWNRALSAGEMSWLNADPFAPLRTWIDLPRAIPIPPGDIFVQV